MDTKTKILRTALELFLKQGYENTSMRQLAQQLNLTKPAIYHHFSSKEQLAVSVIDYFDKKMDDWAQKQFKPAKTYAQKLTSTIKSIPVFANVEQILLDTKQTGEFCMGFDDLAASLARDNPEIRAKLAKSFAITRQVMAEEAQQAINTKELPANINPQVLAFMLHAMVEGVSMLSRYDPSIDLPDLCNQINQQLIQILQLPEEK